MSCCKDCKKCKNNKKCKKESINREKILKDRCDIFLNDLMYSLEDIQLRAKYNKLNSFDYYYVSQLKILRDIIVK